MKYSNLIWHIFYISMLVSFSLIDRFVGWLVGCKVCWLAFLEVGGGGGGVGGGGSIVLGILSMETSEAQRITRHLWSMEWFLNLCDKLCSVGQALPLHSTIISPFNFQLGFVHPLHYVALHQCLPLSSVCCFPVPGGSLFPCYVFLPSSAWSSSWSLPCPWVWECNLLLVCAGVLVHQDRQLPISPPLPPPPPKKTPHQEWTSVSCQQWPVAAKHGLSINNWQTNWEPLKEQWRGKCWVWSYKIRYHAQRSGKEQR